MLEGEMILLWKVGGREQPKETEQQIMKRRGTLISLQINDIWRDQPRVICVMPYMADAI
jgi:hypothetical protein